MTPKTAALQIRSLAPEDLDAVVALDATLAGRTRRAYFERRLAAALRQPALHLQFAAHSGKDFLGHALARVLEGEFGRAQPALRVEVISVARAAQSRGVGRALLEQLFLNLEALRIERVETVVEARALDLLGFFHGAGFAPAQRLSFVKPIA